MRKNRFILALALSLAVLLVAGCGTNDNNHPQQANDNKSQQQTPQDQMSMSMPKGDPMPMMKDMDKSLQDMMRQVKDGQMMDAQKSASEIASLTDKVIPHIMNAALKDRMQKAAYDLRDTMNAGKMDQTVIESKMKTMQDIMTEANKDLASMSHNQ